MFEVRPGLTPADFSSDCISSLSLLIFYLNLGILENIFR